MNTCSKREVLKIGFKLYPFLWGMARPKLHHVLFCFQSKMGLDKHFFIW
ncbi:hypothetical protein ANACOL_02764 [Anaerotruncus colihominis DSM 17241]|uniref:Uncharacterized protein n=1 Tax=Anaerotruncus colihominis DSM 17241 TaxID=445972 RepID=B0PDX9_9FIRM|nr:hypothetical protein ANACOL_02764 [Anaerotruncus colihominis DSM 17241]